MSAGAEDDVLGLALCAFGLESCGVGFLVAGGELDGAEPKSCHDCSIPATIFDCINCRFFSASRFLSGFVGSSDTAANALVISCWFFW